MAANIVHFYNKFQKIGSAYLLAVMPFDAICLQLRFEGLCGIEWYATLATAIIDIIPLLLPDHISLLSTIIATEQTDSNNEFDLTWWLLVLAVPGFNPVLHVSAPVWDDIFNIFNFFHAHILYFCLQA
jgi:hypothetical protein